MNSVSGLITNATSLDLGEYNLDIFATDSSGNVLVTSITVFVQDTTAPVIVISSEDYEYEFGTTDHSVFWIAFDIAPANYTIFLDGSLAVSSDWQSNTSVIFGVDSLDVGNHTIEIRFYDTSMNLVSNIIHITVVAASSTTSTETTSSPTTTPTVDSSILLLLGGGAAGIAFIVVAIVGYKKLKR